MQLSAIALCGAILVCGPAQEEERRTRFDYRIAHATPNATIRRQTMANVIKVLRKRFECRMLVKVSITDTSVEDLTIDVATDEMLTLHHCRRLIESVGRLDLREVADKGMMKRFNADGVCPEGYEVKACRTGNEHHAIKDKALIRQGSIVTGADVDNAHKEPHIGPAGGEAWVVAFELKADGAKRFDDAAERLFKEEDSLDNGLIAILLDGEIQSLPAVNTRQFHGRGIITGQKSGEEADDLAAILKSGSLPVPVEKKK